MEIILTKTSTENCFNFFLFLKYFFVSRYDENLAELAIQEIYSRFKSCDRVLMALRKSPKPQEVSSDSKEAEEYRRKDEA